MVFSNSVIENFINNPRETAESFYLYTRDKKIKSNYVSIDKKDTCCIISQQLRKTSNLPISSDDQSEPQKCVISSINIPEGKIGKPFLVELPDGNYSIWKLSKLRGVKLRVLDKSPSFRMNKMFDATCIPMPDLKAVYIGCDEFTNEILNAYALSYIFNANNFPIESFARHTGSAICHDNKNNLIGVNEIEYSKYGSLNNITENRDFDQFRSQFSFYTRNKEEKKLYGIESVHILSIVRHVYSTLDFLQKEGNFNHGDLKVGNIVLDSAPAKGKYGNINLDAPFTTKLIDFGKSSVTVKSSGKRSIRFYSETKIANVYLMLTTFEPQIFERFGESYYVLDDTLNATIYAKSRHLGLPFYMTWDMYTFMVSLFLIPEIYYRVFTNPDLIRRLWEPLWFPDEGSEMYKKIGRAIVNETKPSYDNIVSMLKGFKLKCALMDRFEQSLS